MTRVGRVAITARSTTSILAVQALRSAERAVRRALRKLPHTEQLIVIRSIRLIVRGTLTDPGMLEEALEQRVLRAVIDKMRRAETGHAEQVFAFRSEATAVVEYMRRLERGGVTAWPFSALVAWGSSLEEVLGACISRGRAFCGDVLAELARAEALEVLDRILDGAVLVELEALWLESGTAFQHDERTPGSRAASAAAAVLGDLPIDVLRNLLERLATSRSRLRVTPGSDDARLARTARLYLLAELFLLWPPVRSGRINANELDALVRSALHRETSTTGFVEPPAMAQSRWSQAGGLVYWARLLSAVGCEPEDVFREPRVVEGVRWAIARSLEDPTLAARDPLLMLWLGSELDAVVAPSFGLSGADPEPLFRLVVKRLLESDSLGEVSLASWGDRVLAFSGDVVLDVLVAPSAHDAVPDLIRRLRARGVDELPQVAIEPDAYGRIADVVAELDVPALPEAWRAPVLAFTSLARMHARRLHGTSMGQTRKWPARLRANGSIELRSYDVERIAGGGWFGDGGLELASRRFQARRVVRFDA